MINIKIFLFSPRFVDTMQEFAYELPKKIELSLFLILTRIELKQLESLFFRAKRRTKRL